MEFLEQEDVSESAELEFLRAVDTLCSAVRAQTGATMNDYLPKTLLAKAVETLILKEAGELLSSSICQQAMLCVVALSHVDPPFHVAQKLDLVSAAISSVFPLPPMVPSPDHKDSVSLYLQTVQALDDMLQALVMDHRDPDLAMVQRLLEILLPWLTMSEKGQEQARALRAISHLLRFICNFPKLLGPGRPFRSLGAAVDGFFVCGGGQHLEEFSVSGRLMGTLGIFCLHADHDISTGASEGLHYLFKLLVLHRSKRRRPGGHPLARRTNQPRSPGQVPEIVQYIHHSTSSIPEPTAQGTVNKVLQLLAQAYTDDVLLTLFKMQDQCPRGVRKHWEILASSPQCYEAIMEHLLQRLTLHPRPGDPEPRAGTHVAPLLVGRGPRRLSSAPRPPPFRGSVWLAAPESGDPRGDAEDGHAPLPCPQATRAIQELLLQPSRRMEVQALFPPLFVALLSHLSFLVVGGGAEALQDPQHAAEWTDPVSSTIEALRTLIQSAGYRDHVSYVQRLGGWQLLRSPERHYEGVTLLARAMVVKNCWHSRPVFGLIIATLRDPGGRNHLPTFVFMTELLQCPDVAATVDDATVRVLADWFRCEEPTTLKLLLRVVEIFRRHGNMLTGTAKQGCPGSPPLPSGQTTPAWTSPGSPLGPPPVRSCEGPKALCALPAQTRQLHLLQPYLLNCCYSLDGDIVAETFLVLRGLVDSLRWPQSSSFLVQLTFTLGPFFEAESESLRLAAFEIYSALLAKVKGMHLAFPLKHQVLNLLVLLVLHLADKNVNVAQSGAQMPPGWGALRKGLCQAGRLGRGCPPLAPESCGKAGAPGFLGLLAHSRWPPRHSGGATASPSARPRPTPCPVPPSLLTPGLSAQVCRPALCHAASILGWSRLKTVFAERDTWTILTALLKQEPGKALWFLKQSVTLFKSPQAPIRQAAVWFAGQIMQALDTDTGSDIEETYDALKAMREDPDPAVGCLAAQTLHVLETKERLPPRASASCLCGRRL
ncbi:maestro heat-like repeat family member 5 [Glossophaga mutica]